jgi:hypothetical protein
MKLSKEAEAVLQRRPDFREYLEKNPMPPIRRKPVVPAVVKTVVEVSKSHPSYTPENGGRLEVEVKTRVDPLEDMYQAAVRREFARPPKLYPEYARPVVDEVEHRYDPIKRFEEGL